MFAQLSFVPKTQKSQCFQWARNSWKLPFPWRELDPRLIQGSFGPRESTSELTQDRFSCFCTTHLYAKLETNQNSFSLSSPGPKPAVLGGFGQFQFRPKLRCFGFVFFRFWPKLRAASAQLETKLHYGLCSVCCCSYWSAVWSPLLWCKQAWLLPSSWPRNLLQSVSQHWTWHQEVSVHSSDKHCQWATVPCYWPDLLWLM